MAEYCSSNYDFDALAVMMADLEQLVLTGYSYENPAMDAFLQMPGPEPMSVPNTQGIDGISELYWLNGQIWTKIELQDQGYVWWYGVD